MTSAKKFQLINEIGCKMSEVCASSLAQAKRIFASKFEGVYYIIDMSKPNGRITKVKFN
jgi:hypothetical protein